MKTAIDQALTVHKEGKLDEAEKLYREILKTQPKLNAIHCNLGSLLYVLGRLNEAEVSFRKAIELKPDYAEAHNNLGNTLEKQLDELLVNESRSKSTWLPSQPFLNLGVKVKLMYERFRAKSDI